MPRRVIHVEIDDHVQMAFTDSDLEWMAKKITQFLQKRFDVEVQQVRVEDVQSEALV